MHKLSIAVRRGARCVVIAAALAALSSAAEAQTKLRWKFTPGEKVNYEMVMDMNMDMKVADKPMSTKMSQRMYMTWLAKEVADDGTTKLTQTMDRVVMELTPPTPDGKAIKYDSDSKEKDPAAAVFASLLDAMVGQSFTITVTPLGEMKDVQIPPTLLEAMKKSSPGTVSMFSEDSLKQMIGRSMFTFPPEVTKGQTWEANLEMPNPVLGKQIITSKYKYVGPAQHEGRDVEKIDVAMEMKFDAPPDSKFKIDITEQSGDGAIFFDNKQGLPLETDVTNKVAMQIEAGPQKLTQTLTTKVVMKQVSATAEDDKESKTKGDTKKKE